MNVPFFTSEKLHESIRKELIEAFTHTLDRGMFSGHHTVDPFEQEYLSYISSPKVEDGYFVSCANGTDAIRIMVESVGLKPGDRIILPAFSCQATLEPLMNYGLHPIFIDVDPNTLLLNTEVIDSNTWEQASAILYVHLFGNAVNPLPFFRSLPRHIKVLEDAAHAHGLRMEGVHAGCMGDAGAFSFYPTKNLGALGEGGGIYFKGSEEANKARMIRNHGQRSKNNHEFWGMNSRMDSLQAALLSKKLPYLNDWNAERMTTAQFYQEQLKGKYKMLLYAEGSVYHQCCLLSENRKELMQYLSENGVGTGIHYPYTLPGLAGKRGDFSAADRAAEQILSLPIFPGMTADQREYVVDRLLQF